MVALRGLPKVKRPNRYPMPLMPVRVFRRSGEADAGSRQYKIESGVFVKVKVPAIISFTNTNRISETAVKAGWVENKYLDLQGHYKSVLVHQNKSSSTPPTLMSQSLTTRGFDWGCILRKLWLDILNWNCIPSKVKIKLCWKIFQRTLWNCDQDCLFLLPSQKFNTLFKLRPVFT